MGIAISSNFDVQTALPLDSRLVVADPTARDAIPALQRYEGMIVYVQSELTNFQLVGGITDGDWAELSGSGGGGGLVPQWYPDVNAPVLTHRNGVPVWEFTPGAGQKLYAAFKVPYLIPGGKPVTMRSNYVSDDSATSVTHLIVQTTLFKALDAIDFPTHMRNSNNTGKVQDATLNGKLQVVVHDLSDNAGRVDGEDILANQLMILEMSIGGDQTSTEPVYFYHLTSEVTFV